MEAGRGYFDGEVGKLLVELLVELVELVKLVFAGRIRETLGRPRSLGCALVPLAGGRCTGVGAIVGVHAWADRLTTRRISAWRRRMGKSGDGIVGRATFIRTERAQTRAAFFTLENVPGAA
jgi:hypothetical protein